MEQRQLICQVKGLNNFVGGDGQYVEYAETAQEAINAIANNGPWQLCLLGEHLKDNGSEEIARWVANNPGVKPDYLIYLNCTPEKVAILQSILNALYPRE